MAMNKNLNAIVLEAEECLGDNLIGFSLLPYSGKTYMRVNVHSWLKEKFWRETSSLNVKLSSIIELFSTYYGRYFEGVEVYNIAGKFSLHGIVFEGYLMGVYPNLGQSENISSDTYK